MTKIFDASADCVFSDRKILFDTNVWIAIDGFDPRPERAVYSNFYSSAKKMGNIIVINDYILGELFNAACRIQYDFIYDDDPKRTQFKKRRKSLEFKEYMDTIRDTCLNLIDDCEFESALHPDCKISKFIEEASCGEADFPDIVIREHCKINNYVMVSHDADFTNCNIELVTANPRILKSIKSS